MQFKLIYLSNKKMFFVDIHIHPTLKPFTNDSNIFDSTKNNHKRNPLLRFLLNLLTKDIPKESQTNLKSLINGNFRIVVFSLFAIEKEFFNSKITPKFLDKSSLEIITGVPQEKLTEDYWSYINKEMEWLTNQSINNSSIYNFVIAKNYTHIDRVMKKNPKTLMMIPSIEGIQCFLHHDEIYLPNKKDLVLKRIDELTFKPLFITFNHHFWNGFSSHANSVQSYLYDQENFFNGITPDGLEIIDHLINKGILIDIKHFDAQSRIDFYKHIKGKNIPIICSHTGISTYNTLDDMINGNPNKKNKDSYFHEMEINLSGEDIREIVNSGGLIGIQFDKKRLVGSKVKITNSNVVEVVLANILKCVEFGGMETWNYITIGSDFDGIISHLPGLKKSSDFTNFYFNLINFMMNPKDITWKRNRIYSITEINNLIGNRCVKELVDRIFGLNAKEFLKRNFN